MAQLTRPFSIMRPANRTPRKGVPSAHMPRAVGYTRSSITCKGNTHEVEEGQERHEEGKNDI